MAVYNEPYYYEIAFSFVDAKKQADLFEHFIKKFSKIKVSRVLDIGCGPSLQLIELAKRGYDSVGLDLSRQMLDHLTKKANSENVKISTERADMRKFSLREKSDFAFIMMGTIAYFKSNKDFLSHLDSVSESLNKGGLYLVENFRLDWTDKRLFRRQSWTMKKGGISVKSTYFIRVKDPIQQLAEESLILDVRDGKKNYKLNETIETKIIFPQELMELIESNGKFEFLGFFERHKMKPLSKASNDNIIVLRKK